MSIINIPDWGRNVSQIKIFSDNEVLVKFCSNALSSMGVTDIVGDIYSDLHADAIVVDAQKIDDDEKLLSVFSNKAIRFLIIGSSWSEKKQVQALLHGAAGYCDISVPSKILLQAVKNILIGDIWIQRHLVPQIIGSLMQAESISKASQNEDKEVLKVLSKREMDVVKMIHKGNNNKSIASALFISERTVKSHLTSIFKKLKVPNRLHLAVLVKEIS